MRYLTEGNSPAAGELPTMLSHTVASLVQHSGSRSSLLRDPGVTGASASLPFSRHC